MLNLQTVLRGFEENGLKQESLYKADEIMAKLDIMGKKEFDREIAEQLFQQCKPTQLNLKLVFRLVDISQTIIDAIQLLEEKIKNAELQLKQIQQNKAICESQLAETSVYSDTRYLFLTLLCVKNIPTNLKYSNCHVQLTLGVINQIAKPETQYDKVNPEFNQDFEFSIPPLISTLQISFYIRTENTLPTLWGQAQLKIQQLDDQVIKQVLLQLQDPVGRILGSSVEMEAQIVLNKHQYLQTQLQKFEQKIFTLDNDLIEHKHNLEIIERPFKSKQQQKEQNNKQLSSNIFNQQLHTSQNQQQDQNIFELDQQQNQLNTPQEQKEQILSVLESEKQLEIQDQTPEAPEILQHGVIIFTIYGLITLFVCSAKPSFLDVLVCHGLMFTILMDRFEPFHIKVVGIGLLASILYDILWMKQYHLWWYSDDQNNPEWGLNAVNLLRFVLIFTYMQFLYKFVRIHRSNQKICIYYLENTIQSWQKQRKRFLAMIKFQLQLCHFFALFLQFILFMNIFRIIYRCSQNNTYRLTEQGSGFSYQINLYCNDKLTSFWHDIPIYPIKDSFNIINVGIEIPKERLAKFEVSKTIKYNPIVQDKKNKKNSDEKELRYYVQFAPFNYGFIPQTWENSTINIHEQFKGDDDPLDILELSTQKVFKPGDIFQAKIIGAFCVLDQGEVDWKILVLNTEEADQLKINEFCDFETIYPDLGRYMLNRFRYIKTFDGKKENQILFNNQIFDAKRAIEIVKEGHQQYQNLLENPNLKMKRQEFLITN